MLARLSKFARFSTLKKKIAVFLTILMLVNALAVPVAFAADAVTVAAWDYTAVPTTAAVPATSGAALAGATLTNFKNVTPTYSTTSLSINGWDNGAGTKYWQVSISTKNYENLTLSAKTRSSGTGPRDFKVVYSTDNGLTWNDIQNSAYAITGTALSNYMPTITLPADAADKDNILINFIMTSNTTASGGTVASTGTSNINNIIVAGSEIPGRKVASVTANPPSGAVALNSQVVLSCGTQDAAIKYSLDGGTTWNDYSAAITLTALPASIQAYASAAGLPTSATTTFNYTQAQAAQVTASPNGGTVNLNSQVSLSCSTPGASIKYSLDDGATWNDYSAAIKLTALPASIKAYAVAAGMLDSTASTFNYTQKTGAYNIYFGQLHSHTTNSDGIGTVTDAYTHAKDVAKLDFLAITDHSNSLDNAATSNMADGSKSTKWVAGHTAADSFTDSSFVGIYAYEMTWSNGTGHINTFNTSGFETRDNQVYKNADGLVQYYNVLKKFTDSISQFNHPGSTFGDFNDFSNYDPAIDSLISLIEVGNGEGKVRSSGYFPSYDYYTRALDKGWHLAPTNNQDNHMGLWGDANTARTVVLADSLTRENVYDAMRNMRVYATEDNNLRIKYTLNGEIMGSILAEKPASVTIKVDLEDPDNEALGKVSVISNGGRVVASQTLATSKDSLEFDLGADYSYYYIRIDEADKDIAVTAPVWIDDVEKAGISGTAGSTTLPMKGQALTIKTSLYNNENAPLNITSLEYSVNGSVIHTAAAVNPVASLGTGSYSFDYVPAAAGKYDVNVKLTATINGIEKTFTDVLKLNVVDPAITTKIVVDASHFNDYVSGYYAGNMTNLITLANLENINVVTQTTAITDDVLKDAQLLVLAPPAKKAGTVSGVAYTASPYTEAEIAAIKKFADNGGNIIITSLADYQDSRTDATLHSAYQQNLILAAIGAGTRINDDEVVDYDSNPNVIPAGVAGGTPYRIPMNAYNTASPYLDGVVAAQNYSFYSGCSITMGSNATWLVKGWPSTYGFDSDNDKLGGSYVSAANKTIPADTGVGKGNMVALATETLPGGGKLFVGGTVFYSNFEIKTQLDNATQLQNSNYNITMNILDSIKKVIPVTPISQVRSGQIGDAYRVEGIVTAGTAPGNAFFDTIYIEDVTGGINIFPVSGMDIKVGQKVKVTGTLDQYQGDLELRVIDIAVTDEAVNPVEPTALSTQAAMDSANGGMLVKVEGIVKRMDSQNIYVDDGSGMARVFVDGYIGDGSGDATKLGQWDSRIQVGEKISAIGLASVDTAGPRLRVRNTAEIVWIFVSIPVGVTYEKTDATLYGTANGSIILTASGGNSGVYGYSIDGGVTWQAGGTFANVAAGTYTAVVRDASYVDNTAVVTVTVGQPAFAGTYKAEKMPSKANVGTAITITPPAPHKNHTLKSVTYSSSKPSVANVDQNGNVTFLAGGRARITVTAVFQSVDSKGRTTTDTTRISKTITVYQPISSITLDKISATIMHSKSLKLIASILPRTASSRDLKWTSSNPRVAIVSRSGVVVGTGVGTAVITCTARDGSRVSASCTITVTPIVPTSVKLSKTTLHIDKGHTETLCATVLPCDADLDTLTWTSDNTAVATVNSKGKVTAIAEGTATITVTTENGLTATCVITIK